MNETELLWYFMNKNKKTMLKIYAAQAGLWPIPNTDKYYYYDD